MNIELFNDDDVKELRTINKMIRPSCKGLSSALNSPSLIKWIIKVKNRAVGCLIFDCEYSDVKIHYFFIHPDYQRFGYGSKTLERLVKQLKQQKKTSVYISVDEYSTEFQLFLQKRGFLATEIKDGKYTMELPLAMLTQG